MKDIYTLRDKLNEFEPWQRAAILNNTAAIQLTSHCTVGCKDCGLGAPIGAARTLRTIPWDYLVELSKEVGDTFKRNGITLHFQSDPFDYLSQGKAYREVHKLFDIATGTYTSIPQGKENEVFNSLDIISRIGVHAANQTRALLLQDRVRVQNPQYLDVFCFEPRALIGPQHVPTKANKSDSGIISEHGVILKPDSIVDIQAVPISKEYPYGFIQTPVTPQNFRIHARCNSPILAAKLAPNVESAFDDWITTPFVITSQQTLIRPPLDNIYAQFFINCQQLFYATSLELQRVYDVMDFAIKYIQKKEQPALNSSEVIIMKNLTHVFSEIGKHLEKLSKKENTLPATHQRIK